ncbi:hypothetical protein JTB14_038326 [Gonioctena quinquepunctata]|nr:hypothetical protein JTB14_038326 [Gonioctena quinquepunctata]
MDPNKCFFCSKFKEDGNDVEGIKPRGFKRIVDSAENRNDYISLKIISLKDEIYREPNKFRFHNSCKQAYCNNHKVKKIPKRPFSVEIDEKTFNIAIHCLFCGKNRGKNGLSFHQVTSMSKMRQKISKAAQERGDESMLKRLEPYVNLAAVEAKYHKKCYTFYTNDGNIAACKKMIQNNEKKSEKNPVKIAFSQLCSEVEKDILINKNSKTVIFFSNRLDQILDQMNVPEDVDQGTYRMRKKLETHFGQRLSFASWAGKPSIVYATDAEYDILASSVQQCYRRNDESKPNPDKDISILHKATEILRTKISEHFKDRKFNSEIPEALYKFLSWILDEKTFNGMTSDFSDENVIAICLNILSAWRNSMVLRLVTIDRKIEPHIYF